MTMQRQGRPSKTCGADEECDDERAYGGPPCDGLGDLCLFYCGITYVAGKRVRTTLPRDVQHDDPGWNDGGIHIGERNARQKKSRRTCCARLLTLLLYHLGARRRYVAS